MPKQSANPVGMKIYRGKEAPKPKKLPLARVLKWFSAILVIILLVAGGTLVAASYLSVKAPLVSVGFQRKVDYLIASVPGIPKTTKQILTKAAQDSEKITIAKQKIEFQMKSGDISLGTLSIESRVDNSDLNNPSLEARIRGEFGLASQVYDLDLSPTQIADDVYFKLDKLPGALLISYGYDLNKIKGKWYQINAKVVRESIGADIRSDEGIKEDIEEKTDEVFDLLDKEKLFQKFQRLPDEKIAGRDSYRRALSPGSTTLAKIFRKLTDSKVEEKEIAEMIKNPKLDLWIDKKNFFVNKMEVTTGFTSEVAGSSTLVGPTSKPIEVRLGYELSEINQKVEIKAPDGATKIGSLAELFLLVAPADAVSVQGVLGASSATAEFGSNVIFLERLIHVVTLFPSSI